MQSWSSCARSVRSVGTITLWVARVLSFPPSRALIASTGIPFSRATCAARRRFGELPLVVWMISRSPGFASASTWRAKISSKPRSLPAAVRSDVSVVSAIAGYARRLRMYRTTYSVARCCASAALPPLPQKNSVPPPFTVSRTIASARSSDGPSSAITRSAVAAGSRRGAENASAMRRRDVSELADAFVREQPGVGRSGEAGVFVCVRRQRVHHEQVEGAVAIEALRVEDRAQGALRGTEADPGGLGHIRVTGIPERGAYALDRKSTRLNSSHLVISYAVFCLEQTT